MDKIKSGVVRMADPFNFSGLDDSGRPIYDSGGSPMDYPEYQGPSELDSKFKVATLSPEQQKAYTDRATSTGPSAWAGMMTDRQDRDQNQGITDATNRGAAATARASDNLAMTGGLDRGAAERINLGGTKATMDAQQGVANQGAKNRLDIGLQDETSKLDMQNKLMDNDKFNMTNALNEGTKKNAFNLGRYNSTMAAWGANKTADAQANAGKK